MRKSVRLIITTFDIPAGGSLEIPEGSLVTPSAQELALARGVLIVQKPAHEIEGRAAAEATVALGADHGGFEMKQALLPVFRQMGLIVRDVGIHEPKTVDYPDIAVQVAELVASGEAARGVIIDGAGIGSAMVANKVPGIRAALCYDVASARNSREHNNANVLTLGGRLLTVAQAEQVLRVWLAAAFAGGRHAARVAKIAGIEKRYSS